MRSKILFAAVILLFGFKALSQNSVYKNEIGIQADNDGFLGEGSDRYYTSGIFLYFRHALTINDTAASALKNKILGFELGQKIYTPQSAFVPGRDFVDRPFAGYLYIGGTLNLLYKNESNLKLEAQVGFVGKNSFGEQVQDLIHKVLGFYTPGGWQYQINNDFEVNLSAEYNRLIVRGKGFDISMNTFADLGTGLTAAGGGFTARFGRFNQLFNSVSTSSTVSASNIKSPNKSELFFYAKPFISFIAYNATIQGSLFEKQLSPNETVTPLQPVILNEQLGANLVINRWVIDVSAIYQTRETTKMVHNGHQWGSITALYRFN